MDDSDRINRELREAQRRRRPVQPEPHYLFLDSDFKKWCQPEPTKTPDYSRLVDHPAVVDAFNYYTSMETPSRQNPPVGSRSIFDINMLNLLEVQRRFPQHSLDDLVVNNFPVNQQDGNIYQPDFLRTGRPEMHARDQDNSSIFRASNVPDPLALQNYNTLETQSSSNYGHPSQNQNLVVGQYNLEQPLQRHNFPTAENSTNNFVRPQYVPTSVNAQYNLTPENNTSRVRHCPYRCVHRNPVTGRYDLGQPLANNSFIPPQQNPMNNFVRPPYPIVAQNDPAQFRNTSGPQCFPNYSATSQQNLGQPLVANNFVPTQQTQMTENLSNNYIHPQNPTMGQYNSSQYFRNNTLGPRYFTNNGVTQQRQDPVTSQYNLGQPLLTNNVPVQQVPMAQNFTNNSVTWGRPIRGNNFVPSQQMPSFNQSQQLANNLFIHRQIVKENVERQQHQNYQQEYDRNFPPLDPPGRNHNSRRQLNQDKPAENPDHEYFNSDFFNTNFPPLQSPKRYRPNERSSSQGSSSNRNRNIFRKNFRKLLKRKSHLPSIEEEPESDSQE